MKPTKKEVKTLNDAHKDLYCFTCGRKTVEVLEPRVSYNPKNGTKHLHVRMKCPVGRGWFEARNHSGDDNIYFCPY